MPLILGVIIALLSSALFAFLMIPNVIKLSKSKHLMAELNSRTVHESPTPTIGGVAIYFSIVVVSAILLSGADFSQISVLFAILTVLLYVGLYDDIMEISASKKLIVQILSALILVMVGDVRITSFHGCLGIYELQDGFSYIISIFIIIGVVNAMNLIDGVDGLASSLCCIAAISFGIVHYYIGHYHFLIIAVTILGSLLPFIFFNVFAKRNKIFMGDTGSLILGTILAVFVIDIVEIAPYVSEHTILKSPHAFCLSAVVVPVMDTVRVFTIRILRGESPFTPGKNHIHHDVLKLGYLHIQTTWRLICITLGVMGLSLLLQITSLPGTAIFVLTLALGMLGVGGPALWLKIRSKKLDFIIDRNKTKGKKVNAMLKKVGNVADTIGPKH